jgi:hypothetical protein
MAGVDRDLDDPDWHRRPIRRQEIQDERLRRGGTCPVPANNSPPKPGRGDSKEGAAGDRALEVGTDHGAELLTPDLEVDGVKQLGVLAVEFSHVDLNVRAAGEQDDGDIRELYQPHGAYGAPPMQRH